MSNHVLETESQKSFYVLIVEKDGVKQYVKDSVAKLYMYTDKIKKATRFKNKEAAQEFLDIIQSCERKPVKNPEIKKVLRTFTLADAIKPARTDTCLALFKDRIAKIMGDTYEEIVHGKMLSNLTYSLKYDHDTVKNISDKFYNRVMSIVEKTVEPVVHVVLAVYDMSDCTDSHGETAGEQEEIKAVCATLEAAEIQKQQLENESKDDGDTCGCHPVRYRISPWNVE